MSFLYNIQSAAPGSEDQVGKSVYNVLPYKKKATDLAISTQETAAALKQKKTRLKKQQRKKRPGNGIKWDKCAKGETAGGGMEVNMNGQEGVELGASDCISSESTMASILEVYMDGQVGEEMGLTDTGTKPTDVAAIQATDIIF